MQFFIYFELFFKILLPVNFAVENCASKGNNDGLVEISVPLGAVICTFAFPAPVMAIHPIPGMTISSVDFFQPSPLI